MVPEPERVGVRLQVVLHLDVAVRGMPEVVAQEPDRRHQRDGAGAVLLDDRGERPPIAGVAKTAPGMSGRQPDPA